ncbi:NAD(P)-binding protein [Atractiella rhizophila]|nr:NAD(P)-binding protein [Atractiella rhizophila]
MTSSSRLIAIVGITGSQGGSVFRALQESSLPYRFRGFTRDTTKPSSQALSKQGVEMVQLDIVPGKEKEVTEAFRGADVVFGMTNFWDGFSLEKEIAQGKLMVDSAISAGVSLFIFSGLESPTKVSGGKYSNNLPLEGKAAVAEYALSKAKTSPSFKVKIVQPGIYAQNFLGGRFNLKLDKDTGKMVLTTDAAEEMVMPILDVEDYGLWVRAAIEEEEAYPSGSSLYTFGEQIAIGVMLKQFGALLGYETVFNHVDPKVAPWYNFFPAHVQPSLRERFAQVAEFGYFGKCDTSRSHDHLARKPLTWRQYVEKHKATFDALIKK